MEALDLARFQFFFTVSVHIIFPAFTIGLSAFIATLLVRAQVTGKAIYHELAQFWIKIFAVSFAMGVVSGLVLSYQFGTNWSRFSEVTGNVIGPLIGYEVLTAFFLEATFLGILLFGAQRVPPWLRTASAIIVAIGTCTSAFWILSASSWMHTPQGHEMRDGIAFPVSWFQIIFNPSFPYRLLHMVVAAYLTTAVVVAAVGARYVIERRFAPAAQVMLRMGLGAVAVLGLAQLFIGDQHGLNSAEHQPAKVAAIEAHWDQSEPGDLVLFAWPDMQAEKNRAEIAIPNGASLLLTHDINGRFPGLKQFAPEDRPPVARVFFAFRIMVGIGVLLIALGITGCVLWWRGKLETSPRFLKLAARAWPLGFIAILCGWIVTESGRQPWLVQGLMRTAEGSSPVSAGAVLTSLLLFVLVYLVVFGIGIYYIHQLVKKGPKGSAVATPPSALPNRPLGAAQEAAHE